MTEKKEVNGLVWIGGRHELGQEPSMMTLLWNWVSWIQVKLEIA